MHKIIPENWNAVSQRTAPSPSPGNMRQQQQQHLQQQDQQQHRQQQTQQQHQRSQHFNAKAQPAPDSQGSTRSAQHANTRFGNMQNSQWQTQRSHAQVAVEADAQNRRQAPFREHGQENLQTQARQERLRRAAQQQVNATNSRPQYADNAGFANAFNPAGNRATTELKGQQPIGDSNIDNLEYYLGSDSAFTNQRK